MTASESTPKYQPINWQAYNQSLKQLGQLFFWLDKGMNWQAHATGKRRLQPTFSDAAIQFCLTIKCLFGLALRQATGTVQSMLHLAGLDSAVPDSPYGISPFGGGSAFN